ncbi:hypothetical protein C1Y40_04655 [Mycobacterium talmoniae]|uniref:Gfo/Idh/MocA-like oxidoreductase N-terminal domain-containing protein n=1 Tax=Mycobacterium talmoniae TaxID=1858794 RepID=A0A2S8BEZ2_9MYCO|nr:Gfo/Idh/MocA family oxidoreductase [Mycobacterium eburneum]PQM45195.1 hypothetical protein C1Y40_04655 [Mycobacterium talmoniae]
MSSPDRGEPTGVPRRRRALVIGSGYRARNAFLPALQCLNANVEVAGVYSRNAGHARRAAEQFGVAAIADLRALRPGDVDLVLVSVTATSNLEVLRAVSHLAPEAELVMDTPAVGRVADLRHLGLYQRWRAVRVAEDFMNLPQFRLIGGVIGSGALGDVVRVRLTKMGFRYHALALLRAWLGLPLVRSTHLRRVRPGAVDIVYRFPGGTTGEVLEPYTRADGAVQVVGTRASLSGHMMGHENRYRATPAGRDGVLERLEDTSGLCGFQICGLGTTITTGVPFLARLRAMGLDDDSEFNLLRVDGLCRVISSLWSPDPVNRRYRIQDAMADAAVSQLARGLPWWPIPQFRGRNPVDLIELLVNPGARAMKPAIRPPG